MCTVHSLQERRMHPLFWKMFFEKKSFCLLRRCSHRWIIKWWTPRHRCINAPPRLSCRGPSDLDWKTNQTSTNHAITICDASCILVSDVTDMLHHSVFAGGAFCCHPSSLLSLLTSLFVLFPFHCWYLKIRDYMQSAGMLLLESFVWIGIIWFILISHLSGINLIRTGNLCIYWTVFNFANFMCFSC